jgi:hypothetical protein
MPSFRQRPLSWLFLIATICVDLVLVTIDDEEELWIVAMLFGQSFVVGGWLALGQSHRLLRGGGFVVGVLALALLAAVGFFEPPIFTFQTAWAQSIGAVAVLAGAAAVMSWGWDAVLRRLPQRRHEPGDAVRWQFPVAELFGWTIIVAVASAFMRLATFSEAGTNPAEMASTLIFALVAALLMALFYAGRRSTSASSVIAAAAAVVAMFVLMPSFVPRFDREIATVIAGSYVYVVLWILVGQLDGRIAKRQSERNHSTNSIGDFAKS